MSNTLRSKDGGSAVDAMTAFGQDSGLLVIRPNRGCLPWFHVPEGCYVIVTEHGKEVKQGGSKLWKAGTYWGGVFKKVSNIVTKQSIIFNAPVKGCKTKDNVNVTINTSLVFRIMGDKENEDDELVSKFVHEVTPEGLSAQLQDSVEEALRLTARKLRHDQVFGLRSNISETENAMIHDKMRENTVAKLEINDDDDEDEGEGVQMTNLEDKEDDDDDSDNDEDDSTFIGEHDAVEASKALSSVLKGANVCKWMKKKLNSQFLEQGVEIQDVIITDVQLPISIREQMTRKTMVISENALQKMTQANDMLDLQQREEILMIEQQHSESRLEELQKGSLEATIQNLELEEIKTAIRYEELGVKATSYVTIEETKMESKEQVTEVTLELDENLAQIHVETDEECVRTFAEMHQYSEEKLAEAKQLVAENESKSQVVLTGAEGKAAPLLNGLKTFRTKEKHLEVYDSLSKNPDLVVSGNHGHDVNTMIMVDSILNRAEGHLSRKQMLSELMVLRDGANIMMQPSF